MARSRLRVGMVEGGEMDSGAEDALPVFISFAEEDAALADEIRLSLERAGIGAWSFTRRRAAGEYQERQRAALGGCQVFLCLITPGYEASAPCRKELQYATAREKVVLPVILTDGWDWERSASWDRLLIYNAVRMQAFDELVRAELLEMVGSIIGGAEGRPDGSREVDAPVEPPAGESGDARRQPPSGAVEVRIVRLEEGIDARGHWDPARDRITILSGSLIRRTLGPFRSGPGSWATDDARYPESLRVIADVPNCSVSRAARIVFGRSARGYREWMRDDGVTLQELLDELTAG